MRTRPLFAASVLALAASACSAPPPAAEPDGADYTSKSGEGDDLGALFGVSSAAIGVAVPSCSAQASSGFVASTGVFTLTLNQAITTEVVIAPVGTTLRVNGYTCVDATGAPIDLTKLTKIVVNGTAGDDAVILDVYLGSFNAKTTGTGGGGVVLALGAGGMDRVGIRGTAGVDTFTAGAHTGRAFVDFTGDGVADAMWTSTAARRELMLATAGGNDFLSGSGRATTTTAGAISATATLAGAAVAAGNIGALTSAYRLSAYGGPGNDRVQGGDGDDLLDGGDGDDSFFTAASADGADVYLGGLGTDTVDYSTRTANLSLTIALSSAPDANDGAAGENDDLTASIENLTGGSGSDVLKGSAVSNVLRGGSGNDVLWGGPGGTCTADVDQLFGDAGDDTFEMSGAFDCGDDLTGGAGNDVATYHDRANALTVSRDDAANDGEATEKDNVRADIEVLVGGQGADTLSGGTVAAKILGCAGNDVITGSSADDVLSGGPGDDVLNGGAGNDTFLEHGDEPLCVSAARGVTASLRGLGSDVINGGAGVEDKVDYSGRTAPLTVTLCVDSAAATGVGTCGNPRNDGEAGEADAVLNVEIVDGGSANDSITGASADDWLYGNGGDDVLAGGGGNDHLDGGAGSNTLTGGAGADICQNYVQATACDLHVYTCNVGTKRDCDRAPENACETDVQTSNANCGACGNACAVGENCTSGVCRPVTLVTGGPACSDGNTNKCDGCESGMSQGWAHIGNAVVWSSDFPVTDTLCVEAWMRVPGRPYPAGMASDLYGILFGVRETGDPSQAFIDDGRRFMTLATVDSGGGIQLGQHPWQLNERPLILGNDWHHIAACVERYTAANGLRSGGSLFVDGVLLQTVVDQNPTPMPRGSLRFWLGRDPWESGNFMWGYHDMQVDEVRVSLGVRYRANFTPPRRLAADSSTLLLWRFDDSSPNNVLDGSGNGRDGTVSRNGSGVYEVQADTGYRPSFCAP